MENQRASVALWRMEHSLLTLSDLSSAAGVHPDLVEQFVSYGLLEPVSGSAGTLLFAASAVERLECIVRLRRDLGINLPGIAVILEMRDRLQALQRELERLRKQVAEAGR